MEKLTCNNSKAITIVIGSCIVDISIYTKKIPSIGESVVASDVVTEIGGKASNQAIGISRLGGNVYLVSRVGNDHWATQAKKIWKSEKVNTEYVFSTENVETGKGIVVIDEFGQNFTLSSLGASSLLSVGDISQINEIVKYARVLTVHLNFSINTLYHIFEIAKKYNTIILLNLSPVQDLPDSIFPYVDVLVVNSSEMSAMVGMEVNSQEEALKSTQFLIDKGVGNVVVSLGKNGAVISNSNQKTYIPAFNVDSVDSTGAGDALNAGIAFGLSNNLSLLEAVNLGIAVSAMCVSQKGTWKPLPSLKEVKNFVRENSKSRNAWKNMDSDEIPTTLEIDQILFEYITPDTILLDVGCGIGNTIFQMLSIGLNQIYGVDINEKNIEHIHQTQKKLRSNVLLADASNLPFQNKYFDCIITKAFWTTVVTHSQRKHILKEIYRVLKEDGFLYITDFSYNEHSPEYKERYEDGIKTGYEKGTFEVYNKHNGKFLYLAHHHDIDKFISLLVLYGFKIVENLHKNVKTRSGNIVNGFTIIAQKK